MEINDLVQNKIVVSNLDEEEHKTEKKEENKSVSSKSNNSKIDNDKEIEGENIKKESNKKMKNININENKKVTEKKIIGKQKNKQKLKNRFNPFFSENNFDYQRHKVNVKHQMNKNGGRSSYLLNCNNELNGDKDQTQNKSVFSKISEKMYLESINDILPRKQERNLEKEGEKNYDKFSEEAYLCSYVSKSNKENQKVIDEFLKRKKKEEIKDRVGIESDKEKENELESLQDSKRVSLITDRKINFKPTRTVKEFLEDQKNKEDKHLTHLKTNEKLHFDKINSFVLDKPRLNDETIKITNKGNKENQVAIHQRLYEEFNDIQQKKEKNEKEKSHFHKNEIKKIPETTIQKNVERLYNEYETKKKKLDETEKEKIKEIKNRVSSRSLSKTSNKIIFKRFKNLLKDSFINIFHKKMEENFLIDFSDFKKLLYKINFTTKNYFDLKEQKNNNNEEADEKNQNNMDLNKNSQEKRDIFRRNNYIFDREYKLLKDAWKKIINNKNFKEDIAGSSHRVIIFCLSVLGLIDNDLNNKFFKKDFSFIVMGENDTSDYLKLSKQIYKDFSLYKNNAINGLLFRQKNINKIIEMGKATEKLLTFNPELQKSSKKYILNSNFINQTRESVDKNYQQYIKNKEFKLKEKEKLLEKEEKGKYAFNPSRKSNKRNRNIFEISQRQSIIGLRHLKINNSTINNNSNKNELYNTYIEDIHREIKNIKKMFNNNPLESDEKVKKKLLELEQSRNKKAYEKLILTKGYIPNIEKYKKNYYIETEDNNKRFVLEDEVSNTFKNTFDRYEKFDKRKSNLNQIKYEFEIIIDRKPRKLIIYKNDDINCKVRDFCNKYNLGFNERRTILHTINHY